VQYDIAIAEDPIDFNNDPLQRMFTFWHEDSIMGLDGVESG
jgi:hypothetical protein